MESVRRSDRRRQEPEFLKKVAEGALGKKELVAQVAPNQSG